MDKPRLKANLSPYVVDGDQVFLITESEHYLVQGTAPAALMPYLNGKHTIGEIVTALGDTVGFGDIMSTIIELERHGHVVDGAEEPDRRAVAAWDTRDVDPDAMRGTLAATTVALAAVGDIDAEPIREALTGLGVQVVDESTVDGGLTVLVTDEYLDPAVGKLCAEEYARGRQVLLVKPVGEEVWVGPHLVPEQTACWQCLHQRLDANRIVEQYIRFRAKEPIGVIRTSVGALPFTGRVAGGLLAAMLTDVVTGGESVLTGNLLSVRVATGETERHAVVRQPQCPACGDPALTNARPSRIELESAPIAFGADGGHRTVTPQQTYDRLSQHVSRLTGIVRELRPLDELDGITYSYSAGHNFALPSDNVALLRKTLRGLSGGKGKTMAQARTSALCEAVERYNAVWRDDRPEIMASYNELGAERALLLPELLGYSDSQYEQREHWNHAESGGRYNQVSRPFDRDLTVAWSPIWSLRDQREWLSPAAFTWFGHPDLYQHLFCYPDGNGNASGNTLEEAILQGFCELVERDSVAIWWYNRVNRPEVDLDSFGDPYLDTLREHYRGMGRSLWLLDLTTDLGIPTFAAVSHRVGHPNEDIILGFGAHLDARLAASRALTEVNQFLPVVSQRAEDGSTIYWEDDEYVLSWWRDSKVAVEPWLRPDEHATPLSIDSFPKLTSGDVRTEVETCVRIAAEHGLDLLVADTSRPEVDLRSVKVIVPGLRHFWRQPMRTGTS